jgi:hypothetical protein
MKFSHQFLISTLIFFLFGCSTPQNSTYLWESGFDTSTTPSFTIMPIDG